MIRSVGDLKAALEEYDDDTAVALAISPRRPFEHRLDSAEEAIVDGKHVLYLVDGGQKDYLPTEARQALSW
ncbi:hypothetical protein [Micromonospora sp. NPDC047730]|uniref:hypothetical protein n=1 Tax=Micromonospora sp. NPDC047730 TaxID=3364253 RepID=UPI003718606F